MFHFLSVVTKGNKSCCNFLKSYLDSLIYNQENWKSDS